MDRTLFMNCSLRLSALVHLCMYGFMHIIALLCIIIIFFYSSSGIYIQPEIAPDTITTWLTTAIAVHPLYGLSVTPKPAEVSDRLNVGYGSLWTLLT